MDTYLCAPSAAIDVHKKAVRFSDFVRAKIHEHLPSFRGKFAASALTSIQVDAQTVHGAVLSVCEGGWAFAAAILLRTSLDLLLSALVIGNGQENQEYLGFKYLRAYLKAASRDLVSPESEREQARKEIKADICRLPPHLQPKATKWAFQGRNDRFWYQEEFARPADVIDAYGTDDIHEQYRALTGSAHGGVLGLRLFRAEPDRVHPAPRSDPQPQGVALVLSSWFLTLIVDIGGSFHGFAIENITDKLRAEQREVLLGITNTQQA